MVNILKMKEANKYDSVAIIPHPKKKQFIFFLIKKIKSIYIEITPNIFTVYTVHCTVKCITNIFNSAAMIKGSFCLEKKTR